MALTTITGNMVSVNAIQGTLIADNAITAVHIATNAVSGTLIADNAVTAVHIAQNSITVTQLADDCVESDKIADGIITTNHLNKAMISSQTEVTAATGDFVLLGDTSDSNNLKKTPVSSIIGLASGTTINNNANNRLITGSGTANTLEGESGLIFDGTNLLLGATSYNAGAFGSATGMNIKKPRPQLLLEDTDNNKDAYFGLTTAGVFLATQDALDIQFHTSDAERMRITSSGDVTMSGTGSLKIPVGTTAQRPTGANGMIRYNSSSGGVEEYRGGGWHNLSAIFSGSGGTTYTTGIYTVHKFTSSGAITFNSTGQVDVLVVAGGGGGGT